MLSLTQPWQRLMSQIGDELQKAASTKAVRMIQAGLLSPASIQRYAKSMPLGSFRTLGTAGRGQFQLADKVVGHIPGQFGPDYAGIMARKLPTQMPNLPTTLRLSPPQLAPRMTSAELAPRHYYGELAKKVRELNIQHRLPGRPDPLVPITGVTDKGLFMPWAAATKPNTWLDRISQILGPRAKLTHELRTVLGDLHGGNLNHLGQVLDPSPNPLTLAGQAWGKGIPRVDFDTRRIVPGTQTAYLRDRAANLPSQFLSQAPAVQKEIDYSNNMIRRFWHRPQDRAALLQRMADEAPAMKGRLEAGLNRHMPQFVDTAIAEQPFMAKMLSRLLPQQAFRQDVENQIRRAMELRPEWAYTAVQ